MLWSVSKFIDFLNEFSMPKSTKKKKNLVDLNSKKSEFARTNRFPGGHEKKITTTMQFFLLLVDRFKIDEFPLRKGEFLRKSNKKYRVEN